MTVSASSNQPATVSALTGGTSTTTSAMPRSSRVWLIPTVGEPIRDLTERQIGKGRIVCFSAEADFVSAAVIGTIGVATLTQVERPRELPLAALPLAFALHQLAEGFVWQELDGAAHATGPAVSVYLFFAWVLLPVYVPVAIMLLEPPGPTRRRLAGFVAIGAVASAYLAASLVTGDVSAHSGGHVVLYGGAGRYADVATALYIVATCGAPLVSRHRTIVWFGIANLFAVAAIATVQAEGLTSIWCSWAAIVSVLIFFQFVSWRNQRQSGALLTAGDQERVISAR